MGNYPRKPFVRREEGVRLSKDGLKPDGFFLTTRDWLTPATFHFYREITYAVFNNAFRTIPPEFNYAECVYYAQNPPDFVVALPGSRVWGMSGAVITPDNKLLWDLSLEYNGGHPEHHSIFQVQNMPPVDYHDKNLGVITHAGSSNYFHWMYDVLPRIELLMKSGFPIDQFVLNYHNPFHSFQAETLNLIGISRENYILTNENLHFKAKNLVVPSLIVHSRYPKWATDFLRTKFLPYARESSEYKRIFISRSDASYRRIANEDFVMSVLENYGFKRISLRNMPVSQQISIFSSAEIVISPHGASLANIAFCKPNTKVVEIFSPTYLNPVYWVISNHANLDYHLLKGRDYWQQSPAPFRDFVLDINALLLVLARLRII
jgi:hypothetical protein